MVMGNPAKVVSYEGSFDCVVYDGMESDPARIASLARAGSPEAAGLRPSPSPS